MWSRSTISSAKRRGWSATARSPTLIPRWPRACTPSSCLTATPGYWSTKRSTPRLQRKNSSHLVELGVHVVLQGQHLFRSEFVNDRRRLSGGCTRFEDL